MEYELLKFFVENQENVWSREELLEKYGDMIILEGLEQLMFMLEDLDQSWVKKRSDWIKTVHSVGYKFN